MHSFASALSCAFAIVIASVPTLAVGFPADHRVRDVGPKVEARDTPPAGAPDNVTGPFYGSGHNLQQIVGQQAGLAFSADPGLFVPVPDNREGVNRGETKSLPGKIPRGHDGSCFGQTLDVIWAPWVVSVDAIKKALPHIESNAEKVNSSVGNTSPHGCTHLYRGSDKGDQLQVDYCGIGNASFDDFNQSVQVLIGNCSFSDKRPTGPRLQGRVHFPFWDHEKQNWIEVRSTITDNGHY